jgi:glyoxylase I family protein
VTVPRPRLHHLALTVSDLDAGAEWYSRVFDVRPQMDVPHPGGVGRILADDAWSLMPDNLAVELFAPPPAS